MVGDAERLGRVGYRCAHAAEHGGEQVVKKVPAENGSIWFGLFPQELLKVFIGFQLCQDTKGFLAFAMQFAVVRRGVVHLGGGCRQRALCRHEINQMVQMRLLFRQTLEIETLQRVIHSILTIRSRRGFTLLSRVLRGGLYR